MQRKPFLAPAGLIKNFRLLLGICLGRVDLFLFGSALLRAPYLVLSIDTSPLTTRLHRNSHAFVSPSNKARVECGVVYSAPPTYREARAFLTSASQNFSQTEYESSGEN
jgi:hypothetical protein